MVSTEYSKQFCELQIIISENKFTISSSYSQIINQDTTDVLMISALTVKDHDRAFCVQCDFIEDSDAGIGLDDNSVQVQHVCIT